ncbi:uncharacterized protein EV154DRAFT_479733 [Mucor mucedo]|uniref:uncharacterized protein n=1 Tax=Mucor mucedo TaxID=29922 RepID=UPI00221F63DA|nr:uncharacterized protein EV154DRAFT_479733 [Mucor mucedo]KAI7893061.1 hypothetical protein EV154DRAFT_479733 [Mucor mucedo]
MTSSEQDIDALEQRQANEPSTSSSHCPSTPKEDNNKSVLIQIVEFGASLHKKYVEGTSMSQQEIDIMKISLYFGYMILYDCWDVSYGFIFPLTIIAVSSILKILSCDSKKNMVRRISLISWMLTRTVNWTASLTKTMKVFVTNTQGCLNLVSPSLIYSLKHSLKQAWHA